MHSRVCDKKLCAVRWRESPAKDKIKLYKKNCYLYTFIRYVMENLQNVCLCCPMNKYVSTSDLLFTFTDKPRIVCLGFLQVNQPAPFKSSEESKQDSILDTILIGCVHFSKRHESITLPTLDFRMPLEGYNIKP